MADISIVTISFNQAQYLRQCIDSVLSQQGVDVQYIVVDPGSSDGSREIIDSYGDRILRVYERDSGPSDGLRRGFLHATAPLLGFLNSDDFFYQGALKIVVDAMSADRSLAMVAGCGHLTDVTGKPTKFVKPSIFRPKDYAYGAVTVFQQGTFFTRSAFDCVGGFNMKNKTCWDAELFLDIALGGGRMRVLKDELAGFRVHGDSITGSNRLWQAYQEDQRRLCIKALGFEPSGASAHIARAAYRVKKWLMP